MARTSKIKDLKQPLRIEELLREAEVAGSSPARPTIKLIFDLICSVQEILNIWKCKDNFRWRFKGVVNLKIYILTDLEGVSGVTEFENRSDTSAWNTYKRRFFSRLLTEEVNAAVRACFDSGASYVLVNDGHGAGYTIDPELIDSRVELIHGTHRPELLPLIDQGFDAMLYIGAHSKAGTKRGVLYHTMSTTVKEISINNIPLGEIGLAAFYAGAYDVPLVFLSGDKAACMEAEALISGIVTVAVKRGLSRFSAVAIPPVRARRLIEEHVKKALLKIDEIKPFKIEPPYVYREYVFQASRAEVLVSNPDELPRNYKLVREIRAETAKQLVEKVWRRHV